MYLYFQMVRQACKSMVPTKDLIVTKNLIMENNKLYHTKYLFYVLVPPQISIRQKAFIVSNGQNIVLPCRARGRPKPKVTWMKNGRAISSSSVSLRLLRTGLAIPFAR